MLKKDGRYLVTGGSGYLGDALIGRLVREGVENLVVVARNEGKLVALKSAYPSIEIIPGDVADPLIAAKACRGVDGIFHLAAFKHVPMAETNAYECVRSNVTGTMNLLVETIGRSGGGAPGFFAFISTDKAAQISGVYGATKFIGEKLIAEVSKANPATKYVTIRYGNVFGSTGSFIYKWIDAVRAGREIIITDPEATRFFFPVERAVDLILDGIRLSDTGAVIIPQIKAVSMGAFAEAFKELYGGTSRSIGLQLGENKHETMDGKVFSNEVPQFTKDEIKDEFLCRIK